MKQNQNPPVIFLRSELVTTELHLLKTFFCAIYTQRIMQIRLHYFITPLFFISKTHLKYIFFHNMILAFVMFSWCLTSGDTVVY